MKSLYQLFSVSEFYGKGSSYNSLVGMDCSKAIAKMSLESADMTHDIVSAFLLHAIILLPMQYSIVSERFLIHYFIVTVFHVAPSHAAYSWTSVYSQSLSMKTCMCNAENISSNIFLNYGGASVSSK